MQPVVISGKPCVCLYSIDGVPGCGKTTVMRKLRNKYGSDPSIKFVFEPVELWESSGLLEKMYNGCISKAEFQHFALSTMTAVHASALSDPQTRVVISERSPFTNILFARHYLRGASLRCYQLSRDAIMESFQVNRALVLKMIHMQVSPDVAIRRVQGRGREAEKNLDIETIGGLERAHVELLHNITESIPSGLDIHASASSVCADGTEADILSGVECLIWPPVEVS